MRINWVLIFFGLFLALAAACTSGQSDPGDRDLVPTGVLTGSVIIGPLCPVEPCSRDVGDTYTSRHLQLQAASASAILVSLNPDGTFNSPVPVGEYTVNLSNCDHLGCSSSLPVKIEIREGEISNLVIDIDTGIRSAVQHQGSYAQLIDDLRNAGAVVEEGPNIDQPFFSVPGRILTVDGSDVQVFEFPSLDDAQAEAAKVAPDGGSVGTSMMNWMASPHFYSVGPIIVLYVGDDEDVISLLTGDVGIQFAGKGSNSPGQQVVSDKADLTSRRELSRRLGVAPEELQLVHSLESDFSDTALGCPDAGVGYDQVKVPGFDLLYELKGVRYPFHVSTDGGLFTDCRRENNAAVPFRLADGIVTVKDAFQLAGGTSSHLGDEVVLQTVADAQAFLSESGGLVDIELDQIDWDVEMLVGTVITGSGCGFDVWVPLVFMHHRGATMDVYVAATQTGLCEKAWAQPVWLIVQEVAKEYSASFILSYRIE